MPRMTLRQLAKAYAKGELDKDSYRQARARLIEGILAGEIPLQENNYRHPSSGKSDESARRRTQNKKPADHPPMWPAPPKTTTPGEKRKMPLIGMSLLGLVFISLLVLYLAYPRSEDTPQGGTAAFETNAATTANNTAGRTLIAAFLQKRSWTKESMKDFVADWRALPQEARKAAAGSVELGQLTNAIYKQLLAEQALSGLDNGDEAEKKQRQLVKFARSIGIDDPRISLPESGNAPPSEGAGNAPGQLSPAAEGTQSSTTTCSPALLRSSVPYCRDPIPAAETNGPTMVVVPPGKFIMGGKLKQEQPRHRVSINYVFAISVHEITYGEFSAYCQTTRQKCPPQPWTGKDYPVVNITWHQARDYARWLTDNTGRHYRLPSEAEWEYAARAGTDTSYPSGDRLTHNDAVFSGDQMLNGPLPKTDRSIHRNLFRIYHMAGNVREWTLDNWHKNYHGAPGDGGAWLSGAAGLRVVRGGSYADAAAALRSAARLALPADNADRYTGFRVVQEFSRQNS
jgi:formylglycine-generating enzyme required for sulfatase activity